jgi:colicin import membrane protein
MRTTSPTVLLILGSLLFSSHWAAAEVFKCTTAEGKTSYSQSPCTAAGATEAVVPIVAPPPGAGAKGRDWAAENAAANARVRAATDAAAAANAQKASAPAKNTQQSIAECEANHGVNCSSAEEIAKREAADRPPTPEEAAAQQRAAAGRRELDRAAAEAKAKADAKPPAPAPVPVKPGRAGT